MAHSMYNNKVAPEPTDEHALTVQDADRLTEVGPVLNTLEKLLIKSGFGVEFNFGDGHLSEVNTTLTTKSGYTCKYAKVVVAWVERNIKYKGGRIRDRVLTISVEGRHFRPVRYDRSNKRGDFNYHLVIESVKRVTELEEKDHKEHLITEANRPASNILNDRITALGLGYGVRVRPDDKLPDHLFFRLDVNRKVSVAEAEQIIEKLAKSGAFKILNGE